MELHEKLEGKIHAENTNLIYAGFWVVVTQIAVLDAVFSLDAVITAVGMVDNIYVMMTAVVIAMMLMLIASATEVSSGWPLNPPGKDCALSAL